MSLVRGQACQPQLVFRYPRVRAISPQLSRYRSSGNRSIIASSSCAKIATEEGRGSGEYPRAAAPVAPLVPMTIVCTSLLLNSSGYPSSGNRSILASSCFVVIAVEDGGGRGVNTL